MNEKQRWLLRDLETWEKKKKNGIGHWSSYDSPRPATISSKKAQIRKLEQEIKDWEKAQAAPFDRERQKVDDEVRRVKRAILFEDTETALKAVRSLHR